MSRPTDTTRRARRLAIPVFAVLALTASLGLQALASCDAQTAGKHISFESAFSGSTLAGSSPAQFTNGEGWQITLSRAELLVGPIYFYSGEARETLVQRLFGISSARACPTHAQFDNGEVLGEVLAQYVVDLLADEPRSTGLLYGIQGTVSSAELHLHPPGTVAAGSAADEIAELDGQTLVLTGTAVKDDVTLPFVAELTIPDEGLMRVVESIPASVALDASSGALTVEALVDLWFDAVRFDTLTEQDEEERFVFSSGTQATNALLQGLRMRDAYRVTWR